MPNPTYSYFNPKGSIPCAISKPKAGVFIVTYGTAAVGITLTAANKVYLMEPALDPATEAQAAGRIHRLGQTREVLIKRFCFRDTIEEAVCELHSKIKSGEGAAAGFESTHATPCRVPPPATDPTQHPRPLWRAIQVVTCAYPPPNAVVIVDGRFPKSAAAIFLSHGVTQPHDYSGAVSTVDKIGMYDKNFGYRCREQACVYCARPTIVAGSVRFWGREKQKGDPYHLQNHARINGSTDERLLKTVALRQSRSMPQKPAPRVMHAQPLRARQRGSRRHGSAPACSNPLHLADGHRGQGDIRA